jgi:hypothetical protein
MKTKKPPRAPKQPASGNTAPRPAGGPQFGEPSQTPDPAKFSVKHGSDKEAYTILDHERGKLPPRKFPVVRGTDEPILKLAEALGDSGNSIVAEIEKARQLVFHSIGDTGNTHGPKDQSLVADKMVSDFSDVDPRDVPSFLYHLGDVVYSFGEAIYYYDGAVIIAVHHPPYVAQVKATGHGSHSAGKHGGSPRMLKDIDAACVATGVWPHAVISGHAHNYQRFTRLKDGRETPFAVCGNGGHAVSHLTRKGSPTIRVPVSQPSLGTAGDRVTFESYDDQNFGYLRMITNEQQLRLEYHPASDGPNAKSPDDQVTVDLVSRKIVHFHTR